MRDTPKDDNYHRNKESSHEVFRINPVDLHRPSFTCGVKSSKALLLIHLLLPKSSVTVDRFHHCGHLKSSRVILEFYPHSELIDTRQCQATLAETCC